MAGRDAEPTPDAGKPDAAVKPDSGGPDAAVKDSGSDASDAEPVDAGNGDIMADAGPPPAAWACADALWADGYCDCGCGVADFDCVGQNCIAPGCIAAGCDACYDSQYAWKACAPAPNLNDWKCTIDEQGDDGICDCGCGIPDDTCQGSGCTEPDCWRKRCNVRHGADGVKVADTQVPPFNEWSCPAAAWGGGDGCDCGCNVPDPDCRSSHACTTALCTDSECTTCHDATGRVVPCTDAWIGWTCDPQRFGSGDGCDCGCGSADPDCDAKGCTLYGCRADECKRCTDTNYAVSKSVGCAPNTWTCELSHYGTSDGCDCGCGVRDPDCGSNAADGCADSDCQQDACAYCHKPSGNPLADNDYVICDPPGDAKGWTCGTMDDAAWKNAECDCGCGRPDPFCRREQRASCTAPGCNTATCQFCNAENGTRDTCSGVRWSGDGTCKNVNYASDGQCDCGCGAIDPDCGDGEGCAASDCSAKGCEVCHGASLLLATCYTWTCPVAAYDDGAICDCGCGAEDPDCSNLGCSEPGCSAAMCSENGCHDPFGRTVACP
jgi:hypothetical protein